MLFLFGSHDILRPKLHWLLSVKFPSQTVLIKKKKQQVHMGMHFDVMNMLWSFNVYDSINVKNVKQFAVGYGTLLHAKQQYNIK